MNWIVCIMGNNMTLHNMKDHTHPNCIATGTENQIYTGVGRQYPQSRYFLVDVEILKGPIA